LTPSTRWFSKYVEYAAQRNWKRPKLVGVCFSEQIVEKVPVDETDVVLDQVISV
jgi:5-formyltetrahydrofolate cyclo-ligase